MHKLDNSNNDTPLNEYTVIMNPAWCKSYKILGDSSLLASREQQHHALTYSNLVHVSLNHQDLDIERPANHRYGGQVGLTPTLSSRCRNSSNRTASTWVTTDGIGIAASFAEHTRRRGSSPPRNQATAAAAARR